MDPYLGWCQPHRCQLLPVDVAEFRYLRTPLKTECFMESLAEGASHHTTTQRYVADLSTMRSIGKLYSALRRELRCATQSSTLPVRRLIDSIAIDGLAYAHRLRAKV